jgi:small subunit ribosomal protein S17
MDKTTTTQRKTLIGIVMSNKMKDTVSVAVSAYVKDPKYKKYSMRTKKYLAHDPGNTAAIGDKVTIRSCRPLSKNKHFEIVK